MMSGGFREDRKAANDAKERDREIKYHLNVLLKNHVVLPTMTVSGAQTRAPSAEPVLVFKKQLPPVSVSRKTMKDIVPLVEKCKEAIEKEQYAQAIFLIGPGSYAIQNKTNHDIIDHRLFWLQRDLQIALTAKAYDLLTQHTLQKQNRILDVCYRTSDIGQKLFEMYDEASLLAFAKTVEGAPSDGKIEVSSDADDAKTPLMRTFAHFKNLIENKKCWDHPTFLNFLQRLDNKDKLLKCTGKNLTQQQMEQNAFVEQGNTFIKSLTEIVIADRNKRVFPNKTNKAISQIQTKLLSDFYDTLPEEEILDLLRRIESAYADIYAADLKNVAADPVKRKPVLLDYVRNEWITPTFLGDLQKESLMQLIEKTLQGYLEGIKPALKEGINTVLKTEFPKEDAEKLDEKATNMLDEIDQRSYQFIQTLLFKVKRSFNERNSVADAIYCLYLEKHLIEQEKSDDKTLEAVNNAVTSIQSSIDQFKEKFSKNPDCKDVIDSNLHHISLAHASLTDPLMRAAIDGLIHAIKQLVRTKQHGTLSAQFEDLMRTLIEHGLPASSDLFYSCKNAWELQALCYEAIPPSSRDEKNSERKAGIDRCHRLHQGTEAPAENVWDRANQAATSAAHNFMFLFAKATNPLLGRSEATSFPQLLNDESSRFIATHGNMSAKRFEVTQTHQPRGGIN